MCTLFPVKFRRACSPLSCVKIAGSSRFINLISLGDILPGALFIDINTLHTPTRSFLICVLSVRRFLFLYLHLKIPVSMFLSVEFCFYMFQDMFPFLCSGFPIPVSSLRYMSSANPSSLYPMASNVICRAFILPAITSGFFANLCWKEASISFKKTRGSMTPVTDTTAASMGELG